MENRKQAVGVAFFVVVIPVVVVCLAALCKASLL
jgi:hypothetical protein